MSNENRKRLWRRVAAGRNVRACLGRFHLKLPEPVLFSRPGRKMESDLTLNVGMKLSQCSFNPLSALLAVILTICICVGR